MTYEAEYGAVTAAILAHGHESPQHWRALAALRTAQGLDDLAAVNVARADLALVPPADRPAAELAAARARSISWETARTPEDIGELTARWLEGTEPAHPAYPAPEDDAGDTGPDEETAEISVDLARLNRAGLVTLDSQPARRLTGTGAAQRASVSGFCGLAAADRICERLAATDLIVVVPLIEEGPQFPVTLADWRPVTWAGLMPTADDLDGMFEGLPAYARKRLSYWTYVTVLDPQWGRSRLLWDLLASALDRRAVTS